MTDILHRVGIQSSMDKVYQALTTPDGLASWWTRNTEGDSTAGGILRFRFSDSNGIEIGGFDMKVVELCPPHHVVWEAINGPEEWVGTKIRWELKQNGDYVVVIFTHTDWETPGEFMHHCSTKWAMFLMSLKALVESGKGAPSPDDVRIGDWH